MSDLPRSGGDEDPGVRWRLRLAYKGTGFRGFAAQKGLTTVAGTLTEALETITRGPVSLVCAGRTDAGVHATGQVVHLDLPADRSADLDPVALATSCNHMLGPAISVLEAGIAPEGFDARRSALSRRYRYLVVNAPVADPLLADLAWHVADPLDLRSMAAAADALLGEHDFRAFCRRVPRTSPDDPIVRRVLDARWTVWSAPGLPDGELERDRPAPVLPAVGSLYVFEIEANAFCHQMVRSLVGVLVEVGRGRKRPSDLVWILRSADRQQAGEPAPPHGLTLVAVRYPA